MSKIIVDRIELKNFFSYGNQWQTVDLREGVNIVLGHDKDKDRSNGSGKSSFLESIPFALFGQTSKGVAQNKIINWKNGKQCEVRLHFNKNGIPYILHRGIKPGILELIKDGIPVPKLSDKRVFQMELEQDLIGIDFKAAEALLFQNANNMISIFNTPKAEKRRFIEKFFNLEIYSKMNEHTNGKVSNVIKRLSEIDMELDFKRRRADELKRIIESSIIPDMDSYKDSVDDAMRAIDAFTTQYITEFQEGSELEKEIDDEREKRNHLRGELRELIVEQGKIEDDRNKLYGEKVALEKRVVAIGDLTEQREKLEKIKSVLVKMEGLEDQSTEKINIIKELQTKKSDLIREFAGLDAQRRQFKSDIVKWEEHEETGESVCPTCFQNVDIEHIRSHIDSLIEDLNKELININVVISDLEKKIIENKQNLELEEILLKDINDKIDKKNKLEKHLAALSGVEEKQQELETTEIRIKEIVQNLIPELEVILESQKKRADVLEVAVNEIELIITEKQVKCDEYKDLVRKQDQLNKDLETETKIYQSQKEIYDRVISEQEINIASKSQLELEVSEFDGEIKKLQKMKDYLDFIKETLKDTNVKQYAIGNIIPFLQQQTNHYLGETGHNYYIELDAWLEGTIKGYGVGDCDFGNMSGGEGKSIDLSLKFAMMDVAKRQAGSYLDILVLDELLDSSIDSHGIEKTFDIIKMKQREDNLKVFIVSHREEVVDFGVDNIYKVTKENSFSTIEMI